MRISFRPGPWRKWPSLSMIRPVGAFLKLFELDWVQRWVPCAGSGQLAGEERGEDRKGEWGWRKARMLRLSLLKLGDGGHPDAWTRGTSALRDLSFVADEGCG